LGDEALELAHLIGGGVVYEVVAVLLGMLEGNGHGYWQWVQFWYRRAMAIRERCLLLQKGKCQRVCSLVPSTRVRWTLCQGPFRQEPESSIHSAGRRSKGERRRKPARSGRGGKTKSGRLRRAGKIEGDFQ
jgi:hypothetical protein